MKPLLAALLLALIAGCALPPVHEPAAAPFTEGDCFRFWQECGM